MKTNTNQKDTQAYELLKIVLPEVIKKGEYVQSIQVAEDAVGIVLDSLRLLENYPDACGMDFVTGLYRKSK